MEWEQSVCGYGIFGTGGGIRSVGFGIVQEKQKGLCYGCEMAVMAGKAIDTEALLRAYEGGRIDLVCVLGPTASGKTRYAVRLAKEINVLLGCKENVRCEAVNKGKLRIDENIMRGEGKEERTVDLTGENIEGQNSSVDKWNFNGNAVKQEGEGTKGAEIISGDSRQVYRDMTIGTGKDLDEYDGIPYHLIDIVPAGTKYNIYEYQRDFEAVYADIRSRGVLPILCGGSGLYIEAVTQGYSLPDVPADPALRAELEKEDTETLIARLAGLKTLHNSTDYDTRQRLIRALEIAIHAQSHPVNMSDALPKNTCYIGISVSREERNKRIDTRLDARLGEGLVEEVRVLLASGISPQDLMYYGLEYKFVTLYVTGQMDYATMRERLAIAIHQFAKRQMTWFRGMERRGIKIHWVEFDKERV